MSRYDIFIGIDPDVEKSGVAVFDRKTKKIELSNLKFFAVFDFLIFLKTVAKKEDPELKILIIIEKGELNKAIFKAKTAQNKSVSAKIGVNVGKNFETTNKLIEMAEYLGIKYEIFIPNKFTPKFNSSYAKNVYGIIERTNQDMRDALRCISRYIK